MNHPWTHFFGRELPLDIYYLDMNHPWTHFFGYELPLDIYYLDMDHCRTYLIMLNMNHKLQLDMDYWTYPIVGH